MSLENKVIRIEALSRWRRVFRERGRRLVVTNGCFDILHAGHVQYLEAARRYGDALLVGLNGDESVRSLKGPGRPLNPENDRALVLAALDSVDAVCIFPEVRAAGFLGRALPDIYVKGGDYSLESLHQEERRIVEKAGGEIRFLPLVSGRSTTDMIERIKRLPA